MSRSPDNPFTRHPAAARASVGVLGLAATAIAVAVALAGSSEGNDALVAMARGFMVAVPIAVGLWAWRKRPGHRFGPLLVTAGFGWFLTTLAESSDSLLYSTGRVAGWVVEGGLVYLVLAFPSGRLTEAVDRRIAQAAAALIAGLYLPLVLLTEHFPVPSPYTSCTGGCPDNAFFVLGSEPAFVDSLLSPLRAILTMILFLVVTGRLVQRWKVPSRFTRNSLLPVVAVASLRALVLAVAVGIRLVDEHSPLATAGSWTVALAFPALALAFLVGLLLWRLQCATALGRLGVRLPLATGAVELEDDLRTALGDPHLRLYIWAPAAGRWVDAEGSTSLPACKRTQRLTEVHNGELLIAMLAHDEAIEEDPEFLDAVTSLVCFALTKEELAEQLDSSLSEVRRSRTRIVAAADRERRRIERNLHDGAQQRLVALRVQIELTEELFVEDPTGAAEKLHGLGQEVTDTLDEIRSLAHGVYPPLLAEVGLREALVAAARRLPMDATVNPDGAVGRYPAEVEGAVYFCCLEAMQNALKHARDASQVTIALRVGDRLRFEIRDDGAGFDPRDAGGGTGLTNMRDRLAAVGGTLAINSSPGGGTVIVGHVPTAGPNGSANGNGSGRFSGSPGARERQEQL